jgi:hypothetical protein
LLRTVIEKRKESVAFLWMKEREGGGLGEG